MEKHSRDMFDYREILYEEIQDTRFYMINSARVNLNLVKMEFQNNIGINLD